MLCRDAGGEPADAMTHGTPLAMRTRLALFLIAASTLMLELLLTRVFDVILSPNMAYMVIASALFAFGLAGVFVTLRPSLCAAPVDGRLSAISGLARISMLALLPALNALRSITTRSAIIRSPSFSPLPQ